MDLTRSSRYSDEQKKTCMKFGADYFPYDDYMMVGISRNFDPTDYPINGLRHPPEGDSISLEAASKILRFVAWNPAGAASPRWMRFS